MRIGNLLPRLISDVPQQDTMKSFQDRSRVPRIGGREGPAAMGDREQNEIGQFPLRGVALVDGLKVDGLSNVLLQPVLFDNTEG